jgi:myo-inositol 2-dehydrogenase/D-chiro-inositol 1-dehydrogenase
MGRYHARVLAQLVPHINVVAVADIDRDAACRAAELIASFRNHGSPLVYDDPYEAMDQVDAVACVVVTSTPTHPELVQTALQSGRHVFCEKPFSFDPAESMRLGAVAHDRGLNLAVGFYRHFPLLSWLRVPSFGPANWVGRCSFVHRSGTQRLHRKNSSREPVGIAVDFGVHEFDSIEWLSGQQIVEIRAIALPVVSAEAKAIGEFDNLLIEAKLEGGAVAMIDLSMNCGYADDVRTEFLGEKGALFIETTPESKLTVGTCDGLRTIELEEAGDAFEGGITGELRASAAAVNGHGSELLPMPPYRLVQLGSRSLRTILRWAAR